MPDQDTSETPRCAVCAPYDCECHECGSCGETFTDDCQCTACPYCPNCCSHVNCPSCERRVHADYVCGNCGNCTDYSCCDCSYCGNCEGRYSSRNFCGECERCNDCCDCMAGGSIEFFRSPVVFRKGHVTKLNPSRRFISVEIESQGVEHDGELVSASVRKWRGSIVTDGSLGPCGFEINTAPASGHLWTEQIDEICGSLRAASARVDNDCGLHVHIDARDFGYYDLRRLVFLYEKLEWGLFALVKRGRETSRYCEPCGERFARALVDPKTLDPKENKKALFSRLYGHAPSSFENKRTMGADRHNGARYSALNLHSWFVRGTIECRMHHGSVHSEKIQNWGMLWARILDYAFKAREKDIRALPHTAGYEHQNESFALLHALMADLPHLQVWLRQRARAFGRVSSETLSSLSTPNHDERMV